ncbi:MAG: serine hydrolase domain-containing protein [Anaerolineae bacterium]
MPEMSLPQVSPQAVGVSTARLRRVDSAMQRYMDEGKLAGLVTIFARRGQIFHVGCYGMADRERQRPMQPDTIFRMWSITKAVTAAALMLLYEEGHFVLDQDIADFLPAFKATQVYAGMDGAQPKLVDKQRPITIRQLLLHTTGMASKAGTGQSLPDVQMANIFVDIERDKPKPLAVVVDEMARVPLASQPNTHWVYGPSFDVAARLIEVISGQSFNAFLRARLFEPLGMSDSHHIVSAAQLSRFSTFYASAKPGELTVLDDPATSPHYVPDGKLAASYFTSGGTGLISTPEDTLRFALMLANRGQFNGVRILAPRTVALMTVNHLPPHLLPYGFDANNPYYGYGHGLGVHTLFDNGLAGIPDALGTYWKDGGSGTLFWNDPAHELTCVALYQLSPFNLYPLWTQLRALVYQALDA